MHALEKKAYFTFLIIALVALACGLVSGYGVTSHAATQAGCDKWRLVKSPNVTSDDELYAVSALSSNNIWAVGEADKHKTSQTLIENWNGSAWKVVASPSPTTSSRLPGVTAITTDDVWAVGSTGKQTLIEHWNGTAWSVVTSPSPGKNGELDSVAALSTNDVWAAGYFNGKDGSTQTLVEHWNGTSWRRVKSPNVGSDSDFYALAAIGANDIWAVGDHGSGNALIEHWDGKSWSIAQNPGTGSEDYLFSLSADAANDVWAAGYAVVNAIYVTLVEHWDGTQWSIVPSPNPGPYNDMLSAVQAISSNNVWVTGTYKDTQRNYDRLVFTLHWDGSAWQTVPSPNPGSYIYILNGLAQVPGSRAIWAVGQWRFHGYPIYKTLMQVYC